MKKYVLSALACGVICSTGFASSVSSKTLSDYAAPPASSIIKDNEVMVGAEWLSLSTEGAESNSEVNSLVGYRLQWTRNFAQEEKGFWSASLSWGQAWGEGDFYDATTNSLKLGIDRNMKVQERLYVFVGPRIGMSQTIYRFDQRATNQRGTNLHFYDNSAEMGLGAGVKYYFPNSANCLTVGVQYMWRNSSDVANGFTGNKGMSVTTIYAGYSFAF